MQINKKRYYISEDLPNVDAGIVLPSVTTVASATAPIGKTMALINWRKRVGDTEANRRTRNAVERGNWLHGVLEDQFNGGTLKHISMRFLSTSPITTPLNLSLSA